MAPKAKAGAVEKTKRATKPKKDPNAPKGASGPYIWFCNEKRAAVKAKNPSWGIAEIGKDLGGKWKALTDKEKEPYNAQAAKDKERAVREQAAYKKKHPDGPAAKSPAKATKAKKDVKPTKKAAKEAPKMLSEDEDDMEEAGDDE